MSTPTQGRGAPRRYLHFGEPPKPPKDKHGNPSNWVAARATSEEFQFLVNELQAGRIIHTNAPHHVYNSHPELYSIKPAKFPKFWKQAVLKALGIDINVSSDDFPMSTTSSDNSVSL